MPVSDFPGRRNWGYDGVLPFAPDSTYGRPEELKELVQAAHARGIMVLLDVVYNHFGPEGNYLGAYAPQFFTDRHKTPWGNGINFDGPESRVVRDFFIHNALYWLTEYHLDGLRLDAVHAILDDSTPDILAELATTVRNTVAPDRQIHLILENERNQSIRLRRTAQCEPRAYDAQWNDDIHHALHVLITSEKDGYYSDYADRPLDRFGRVWLADSHIRARCRFITMVGHVVSPRKACRRLPLSRSSRIMIRSEIVRSEKESSPSRTRGRFVPRRRFFCWLRLHPCSSWVKSLERNAISIFL